MWSVFSRPPQGEDVPTADYVKRSKQTSEMSPAATALVPVKETTVAEELQKYPEIKKEYIKALQEWIKKQPHLPQEIDDMYFIHFLRACNCSIEKTKTVMENFFTFRTHVPEMSIRRTTDQRDLQQCFQTIEMAVLENRDAEGNIIVIQRMRDTDASKYDPCAAMRAISMLIEAHIYEHGSVPGGVLICDQKGYGLGHLAKVPLPTAKKIFFYLQECVSLQVKKIHVVNANQYIEKILLVFKTFMNKELANSIRIHREGVFDGLHKDIPKAILPTDYNGDLGKPLAELHDEGISRLHLFNELFVKTDSLLVDETKRSGKAKSSETLFGMEGSFKKLDID